MYPNPKTLELIVAHYRLAAADRAVEDAWWRAESESWRQACRRAAASVWATGAIHGHQKRPGADVCARFGDVVADISDELAGIDEFERLLDRIEAAGAGFHGVGELVCYDTADRLALRLGCEPLAVYLHSGTRIGARQLVAGIRKSTRSIPVSSLPGALAEVTTREAEDILCIYAGRFYDAPADFEAWANRNLGRCGPKRSKRGIC